MPKAGEFHARDGFYFSREEGGVVRIRVQTAGAPDRAITLHPPEWASILAHVSVRGDNAAGFSAALALHMEAKRPAP